MNKIIQVGFLLALALVKAGCDSASNSKNEPAEKVKSNGKPNIVFIFSDDQSYSTLSNLGGNDVFTPSLDALAAQGVTFSHAYNMGGWNGAVCLASRAMLNTGRSLWDARALESKANINERYATTWGKVMKNAGYSTYMTGKWHVHVSAEEAFDTVKHVRAGMPKDHWDFNAQNEKFAALKRGEYKHYSEIMPVGYNRPLTAGDDSWSPTNTAEGGFWQGGQHWSETLKDDALEFIADAKQHDNPFFMYLAFNAPHDPRQAPQEFQDIYELDAHPPKLPDSWLARYPYQDAIGNGPSLRDSALAPFPRTELAIQTHRKEYFASISHMDQQIGAIVSKLEESGLLDNTYIIFSSDHGLAVGEHGLFGKQNMYEHSLRAPFIILGPELPKGEINSTNIYIQDAMATTLDIAGIKRPDYLFFNSVLPLAKGEQSSSYYDAIYGAYIDLQRMIKVDGYKLIVYPKANAVRLYNLNEDPNEMNDLATQSSYQSKAKSLFKKLMVKQKEMNDPLDLSAIYHSFES